MGLKIKRYLSFLPPSLTFHYVLWPSVIKTNRCTLEWFSTNSCVSTNGNSWHFLGMACQVHCGLVELLVAPQALPIRPTYYWPNDFHETKLRGPNLSIIGEVASPSFDEGPRLGWANIKLMVTHVTRVVSFLFREEWFDGKFYLRPTALVLGNPNLPTINGGVFSWWFSSHGIKICNKSPNKQITKWWMSWWHFKYHRSETIPQTTSGLDGRFPVKSWIDHCWLCKLDLELM